MEISADYKSKFFALCVLHNITSIEVTFSGSGDSGSFDGVEINGSHSGDLHELQLDWPHPGERTFEAGVGWVRGPSEIKPTTFDDVVSSLVNEAIDRKDIDWYNNEGGGGHWKYENGSVDFHIYYNVVSEHVGDQWRIPVSDYLANQIPEFFGDDGT